MHTVALVIDHYGSGEDIHNQFFIGALRYVREKTLWKLIPNNIMFSLDSLNPFSGNLKEMAQQGVEGILRSCHRPYSEEEKHLIRRHGIKAVNIHPSGKPDIVSDNREIGRLAARHFLSRGFRSFGFIGEFDPLATAFTAWSRERMEGFGQAVEQHGFPCSCFSYSIDFTKGGKYHALRSLELREWVQGLPKPVGILAANDVRGVHVLEACDKLRLEVPSQVAVVGVDNFSLLCESRTPSLSSVDQNGVKIGYETAALLDKMMNGEEAPSETIVIAPREVVTRMSSDVLAVQDAAVAKALVYIRDHLPEPFSILEVVAASGVSRRVLETRFNNLMSRTIHDVIQEMRLEKAKHLLRDTLLSISRVAEESGFRRGSYLAYLFEMKVGVPPHKWREKNRL